MKKKTKALLLLSGGQDSREALRRLKRHGFDVHALCIDGVQGKEKIGARRTARASKIPLSVVHIPFFDENTWNPLSLIRRDFAMICAALKLARNLKSKVIAIGVKKSDVFIPALFWLLPALGILKLLFAARGVRLSLPVWDLDTKKPPPESSG